VSDQPSSISPDIEELLRDVIDLVPDPIDGIRAVMDCVVDVDDGVRDDIVDIP
jgi:hypothetical protein